QITYTNVPMRALINRAYGTSQRHKVAGPGWIDDERYDIVAKVPAGATRDQVNDMLQALLAERFQLTVHHETRDIPGYEITVAKGRGKGRVWGGAARRSGGASRSGRESRGQNQNRKGRSAGTGSRQRRLVAFAGRRFGALLRPAAARIGIGVHVGEPSRLSGG